MGQKVYIWSFKDNDLVGISFLDLQIYMHQMISIRNLTFIGDVFNSVCLLRYQEQHKALSLASRDPRKLEVRKCCFEICLSFGVVSLVKRIRCMRWSL